MKGVVVYGSKYGTTKLYSETLAEKFNFDCYDYKKVNKNNIDNYNYVIYGGGLYAGGVLGLSKTIKKINNFNEKEIIIFTVGLADPLNTENIVNIRKSIKRQIPDKVYKEDKLFHLRGGIDYSKLSFKDKTMMNLLYKKVKKIPVEQQDDEVKAIIETFNKQVNFVNLESLKSLENHLIFSKNYFMKN